MAKFTIVAYFLWLVVGYFGVHHFYLGRDKQGLLWLTSLGGCFIGWMRDFYRIPTYVKQANNDQYYLEDLAILMRRNKRPGLWKYIHRIIGQCFFGYFYRDLIRVAIPEEYYEYSFLLTLLLPLGTAVGTYMVSNCGEIKSQFKYSLLGAYLGEVLFGEMHIYTTRIFGSYAVVVSMVFSTYGWEWNRTVPNNKSFCQRLRLWIGVFFIFSLLCGSFIYFNMRVNTQDGGSIKVRDALRNFFKSPKWAKIKASMGKVFEDLRNEGWESAKKRLTIIADVEGEDWAREFLGVPLNATMKEVKDRYRELAKKWHPDKHSGADKEAANEKFMELTEAYETLQKVLVKREERYKSFTDSK